MMLSTMLAAYMAFLFALTTGGPNVTVKGLAADFVIVVFIVGGAATIWKVIWPLTKAMVELAAAIPAVKELADSAPQLVELAKVEPTIMDMAEQFKRNGGSSMRDDMDKVLANSVSIVREQARVKSALADQAESLEDHSREDERRFTALHQAIEELKP